MRLPTPLLPPGDTRRVREVAAATVEEAIARLAAELGAAFASRVLDGKEGVRPYVNVYVNGEDVRFREGLATRVAEGDELSILPAIAGGAPP